MTQKEIEIGNKIYKYNEIDFVNEGKKINKEISRENLKILCDILNKTDIKYGLIFGTLLGAIRENNFIDYDEDTDIYILIENKNTILNLLFELRTEQLELVRFNEDYFSIMRNNEYIDIYFFKPKRKYFFFKVRQLQNRYEIPSKHLEKPISYNFLNINCFIPNRPELVLRKLYGKSWRIPKKNKFAKPNTIFGKIINLIPLIKNLPFYKIFRNIILKYF